MDSLLCSVEELHALLARDATRAPFVSSGHEPPAVRVLDLRWAPSGPSARERYLAGHIPGALFADLDRDLSNAQPRGPGGRHPMVSPEQLAAALSRWGIGEETQVIFYDDGSGAIAARGWFQLRLHGHAKVRLLDGGLWAWKEAGLPLETTEAHAAAAPRRTLTRDESRLVDRKRIERFVSERHEGQPGTGPILLDARAPERYRGDVEPIDPIAGHIPGAKNLPFASFLRGGGAPGGDPRWRSPGELRALLDARGLRGRELIASCGSGVTACHILAALEQAGYPEAKLYGGSYSDWVSVPGAPVEKGDLT